MSLLLLGSWMKTNVRSVRNLRVAVILAMVVVFTGSSISCSSGEGNANEASPTSQTSPSPAAAIATNSGDTGSAKATAGSITATPNPVPAGEGNGRTKISWKTTGDVTPVEVYVAQDAQPEVKFAEGAEGSADAPWIVAGSNYEFRLYAGRGATRKLINKIQVKRNP